jgi:hypothetical protein
MDVPSIFNKLYIIIEKFIVFLKKILLFTVSKIFLSAFMCLTLFYSITSCFLMLFIANNSPVSIFSANITFPKVPFPITFKILKSSILRFFY